MIRHEKLYEFLKNFSEIPRSEWDALCDALNERTLEKGDYYLQAGEQAKNAAFIIEGYVRMFYIKLDGTEFNHHFMFENNVMAGYPSLLMGVPSEYYIQAMEDMRILEIDYGVFNNFFDRHPCWERLGRRIAELNYVDKIGREAMFLLLSASERYLKTLELFPGIEKRVPQYHMASYLGVTASSLNKIIKKL